MIPACATTFALALALALSGNVDAYWRMNCGTVQTGRIDPIIAPGQVSSHVHKISGGSNIGISAGYSDMRASACTSCEIQADKSGYWTPQLYYQHSNGSFEEVPNGGTVVYYLGRGDNRANIVPFPPGFMMISGDLKARSYDNTTMTFNNATVPGRPVADRVSFNCLGADPWAETPYMSNTNCPDGLRAQIQFPSCWDGVNNYLPGNGHVDYMSQIDNGVCSSQFPVQLVHLFYEVLYGVNDIVTDGGQFVFAFGDTTGYGFHGDFLNGWDMSVLTPALAQCANTDNGGAISACAPLAAVDIDTFGFNCPQYAPYGAPLINETVLGLIGTSLPGCINIVNGPQPATASDYTCAAGVAQPAVENFGQQSPVVFMTLTPGNFVGGNGWQYVDCYDDNTNNTQTLSGSEKSANSMSIESCQTYCSGLGYRYAGVEYGSQCFCSSIIASTASNNQTGCSQVCAGNGTEFCGGPNRISIFNNTLSTATIAAPGSGATSTAAGTYWGCVSDGNSGRTLTSDGYNSNNMTLESCRAYCDAGGYILSGTEYSSECFCGNTLSNGGALLSSNSSCNMICSGNVGETCGGPNRLSVFNSTTVAAVVLPSAVQAVGNYSLQGCWIDGSTRALAGGGYNNGSGMTVESCVAYCAGKSYNYAGVEYSSECYCGNSLQSGSLAALSDCSMLCSGNKTEFCGAGNRLNLYWNGVAGPSSSTKTTSSSSSSSSSSSTKSSSVTSTSASSSSSKTSSSSTKTSTTSSSSSTKATTSTTSKASTTSSSKSSSTASSSSSTSTH